MLNESEYKKIIKQVESLDERDPKLANICKRLFDGYFTQRYLDFVCKVIFIGVNPRNIITIFYKYFKTSESYDRIPESEIAGTSCYSAKYFCQKFDLADKETYEKAVDDLCMYLKN